MKYIDDAIVDYIAFRSQHDSQSVMLANLALLECFRYVETDKAYLLDTLEMLLEESLISFKPRTLKHDANKSIYRHLVKLKCFEFEAFDDLLLQIDTSDQMYAKLNLSLQMSLSNQQDDHVAALMELLYYTLHLFDQIIHDTLKAEAHIVIAHCLFLQVLIEFIKIEIPIHEDVHSMLVGMHQAILYHLKNKFTVLAQYQVFDYYVTAKTVSLIELSMRLALIECDRMDLIDAIKRVAKSLGYALHKRNDVLECQNAAMDIKQGILNYVHIKLIQTRAECLLMSFNEIASIHIEDAHLSSCIDDVNCVLNELIELVGSSFGECAFSLQLNSITANLYIEHGHHI